MATASASGALVARLLQALSLLEFSLALWLLSDRTLPTAQRYLWCVHTSLLLVLVLAHSFDAAALI